MICHLFVVCRGLSRISSGTPYQKLASRTRLNTPIQYLLLGKVCKCIFSFEVAYFGQDMLEKLPTRPKNFLSDDVTSSR